ncbi:hypothetical protein PHJA_002404100 [Phtheirospermum japonicum]|uniref:C2 domain-containing protein n=1 Tax=Phtheirospermum japonicum TaxID=374723 RepID=A0A830CRV7_9LAMI|nr:hypothetical protein PHJA_002404100 [Phtheirospermum japonicum]
MAPGILKPFQLLEINIISAQDLEPVSKKMKTYARAWVNPNRKLSSCVDAEGNNNPTWNDKFVFRVDEDFLREDSSAVMIEIYALHWLRDLTVGTVRVLVGNLIPPPVLSRRNNHHIGMRFIALQVRRQSGRPQGILNIGVALLDGSLRSMPLYTQVATSAVGYHDLMHDPPNLQHLQNNETKKNNNNQQAPNVKPILRRSRSERSERVILDNCSPNSSIVAMPIGKNMRAKESSIISISEPVDPFQGMKKKGKASSVISGAELRDPKPKGKKGGKANSVVSDSVYSKVSSRFYKKESSNLKTGKNDKNGNDEKPVVDEKSVTKVKAVVQNMDQAPREMKALIPATGNMPKGPKNMIGGPLKGNSIWSDSEVGPSPSEVAATIAQRRYQQDDKQSSVLDGWSVDESVEGLRSKLERWRMDLPPLYDNGSSRSSYRSSCHHGGRNRSGSGLFSCFGNICGYECQCVCGKPPRRKNRGSRYMNSSVGTSAGRSFL